MKRKILWAQSSPRLPPPAGCRASYTGKSVLQLNADPKGFLCRQRTEHAQGCTPLRKTDTGYGFVRNVEGIIDWRRIALSQST